MLYFTTVILTHRPFWSIPANYQICLEASRSIEKLVVLLETTFGLENITYLTGYCIYTGASAILDDVTNSGHGSAHPVLSTFLRALNAGMKRCPLLERSLNIIIKGLNRSSTTQQAILGDTNPQEAILPSTWIPAFPYFDPGYSIDFNMTPFFEGNRVGSMTALDCFPETQLGPSDMMYRVP